MAKHCGLPIVITSHTSASEFPNNEAHDFTNRLPEALNLSDGNYEVALEEIHYIRALSALEEASFNITHPPTTDGATPVTNSYVIGSSTPTSVFKFIKSISDATPAAIRESGVRISYNKSNYTVSLVLNRGFKITFPIQWSNIMGLNGTTFDTDTSSVRPADLYQGIYHGYIYSDVGETVPVGSSKTNLLAIVPILNGQRVVPEASTIRIDNPMYVRVAQDHLQTVRIYILDSKGKPLQLRIHPTTVRLRVRPCAF